MVVVHDVRLFGNRLSALILSRLAEVRQEVVHHKDALDGTILLDRLRELQGLNRNHNVAA